MSERKREKHLGRPTANGGRYAEDARAESRGLTTDAPDSEFIVPLPETLDPNLIASIPDDHDGYTYTQCWNERFEILTRTDLTPDPTEYVKDALGLTAGHIELAMYRRAGDPRSNHDLNGYVNPEEGDYSGWTAVASVDTASDVDGLANHEGLLFRMQSEWDDESDRYIVALPNQDEAREVHLGRVDRREYDAAKELYDKIASGQESPLAFLGFNPKTMKALDDITRARRDIVRPEPPSKVFGFRPYVYNIHRRIDELGEERIKPLIEALQGNRPLDENDEGAIKALVDSRAVARTTVENTEAMYEAKQRLAKLEQVSEVLDSGAVPPLVAEYLSEDGALAKDMAHTRRTVEWKGEQAKALRGFLRPALVASRKTKELDAKAKMLLEARRWPGTPESMPPEFADTKERRDPFSFD